ncbi:MAG TPA: site-specific integrase [Chitinophagaceae bacterium]|jgi:site-specific recombinase XerD|nr:site-specific integrase [Chitinophagaceae bacterium]
MKVIFWLYRSHTNKKGLTPIMMRITLAGQRTNFPTQISIPEKAWDNNRQQVKGTDDLSHKYNQYLLTLRSRVWEYYNQCLKEDRPLVLSSLKGYVQGNDASQHTLLDTLDYHIDQLKSRVGNDLAPATVKKYETVRRKIIEYLEGKGKEDITLEELSHQFIQEFDQFMRVRQGLKNNGVIKNMQQLKRVLRVALQNEWMKKDPFAHYQCKIVEPKRVHLTTEELIKVEQLYIPGDRLQRVRDVFVFCCYTGLAYADVRKLTQEHIQQINSMDWIILDRTKTKNQSVIPILPKAREVLNKYPPQAQGRLLPVISSQNMNKYLKELAGLSGINKRFSFHAARHTFATTVTLNAGVDITTVSAMLGHKMLKTTQIYARVNMEKIARDVGGILNVNE